MRIMRTRLIAGTVIIVALALAVVGMRLWASNHATAQAPSASVATASPALAQNSPTGSPMPSASASPVPTAEPTIPTPPPGLPAGWADETERIVGGPEADLVVRTGAIDNFGFGWPSRFTPFSGASTPVHPWVCSPRPGAAPGTDRTMLGTGVTPADVQNRPA
ncbi:MAG: hypothetical protein ACYDBO_09960, partial [Vulcanimicrobiaceae bacterium]